MPQPYRWGFFMPEASMINYEQLKRQLINHEGLRLKPYKCTSNKLTIGVGRNLEAKGISEDEAMAMLDNDIVYFEEQLRRRIPSIRDITHTRQAVLVNMAFNLGVNGLLQFKNMLKALINEDFEEAATQLLDSRYAKQVGRRAHELAEQLKSGEWQ
ncbi:MAG: lysozyme [Paraglaciecola sp.]